MSMLHQWATGDNTQSTAGTYDNAIPNTEPTDDAYVHWKAAEYSAAARRNLGGSGGKDNSGVTTNPWNWLKMYKYRKILKHNGKRGAANMAA